jgi:hypothetical protein
MWRGAQDIPPPGMTTPAGATDLTPVEERAKSDVTHRRTGTPRRPRPRCRTRPLVWVFSASAASTTCAAIEPSTEPLAPGGRWATQRVDDRTHDLRAGSRDEQADRPRSLDACGFEPTNGCRLSTHAGPQAHPTRPPRFGATIRFADVGTRQQNRLRAELRVLSRPRRSHHWAARSGDLARPLSPSEDRRPVDDQGGSRPPT